MNIFSKKTYSLALLLSAIVVSSSVVAKKDKQSKRVKYVQAGAGKGNGSKKRPYNSLAAAQADETWDTLIVLPSPNILDGSIILRSGTTLKGTCDPTCGPLSINQATITNSNSELNNGNAVVVEGDACIKKLYFKDTWASAINYDNGRNLTVKKVLITGHNQGDVQVQTVVDPTIYYPVAGIFGQPTTNGTTQFKQVIVKDNNTGGCFIEEASNNIYRKISVEYCELTGIRSVSQQSPFIAEQALGMDFNSVGEGTYIDVFIGNCNIHDFRPNTFPDVLSFGIEFVVLSGGMITACIEDCLIQNIYNNTDESYHVHILQGSGPNKVTVKRCRFEEPLYNINQQITAIQSIITDTDSHMTVKDNTFVNVYDNIVSWMLAGATNDHWEIRDNCGSGAGTFFFTYNISAEAITEAHIVDNIFTGGSALGAIGALAQAAPWKKIALKVERNCLDGQGAGFAGLYGIGSVGQNALLDAGLGALGSKGHNNITGYEFDIYNISEDPGLTISAQKNWWGEGNPCSNNSECASTQTCRKGVCVGPDNVVNTSNAVVNVSKPLSHPAKCSKICTYTLPKTSHKEASINGTKTERLEERLKNRQERFTKHLKKGSRTI